MEYELRMDVELLREALEESGNEDVENLELVLMVETGKNKKPFIKRAFLYGEVNDEYIREIDI